MAVILENISLGHTSFLKRRQVRRQLFFRISGGREPGGFHRHGSPNLSSPGSSCCPALLPVPFPRRLPPLYKKTRQIPGKLESVGESWGTLQCNSFGSNTAPSDATQPGRLAQLTVRMNGTLFLLLPLHSSTLYAVIRPRLTLQWLLNIKNKNVQTKSPAGYVCVCYVCPSALVKNLQTSQFAFRTSAPRNPTSSQGFPYPGPAALAHPKR